MRRAPVHGGPSSGKPYLVACPSLARLIRRNRLPPPTSTIPASAIGPELLPVKGSWPPPEVVLVAPAAAPEGVVSSEGVGETLDEGGVVVGGAVVGGAVVGGAVVGGAVVGGAVLVVGISHLSGSSVLPEFFDFPSSFQKATAVTVTVPWVPAGRTKSPENELCSSLNSPEGRSVFSPSSS